MTDLDERVAFHLKVGGIKVGFPFNRRGDLAVDPRGAQIVFTRAPHGRMLGDVRDHYRDEDGTVCLIVTHFNGEPWPIDPPAALVGVLQRAPEAET